MQRFGLFLIVTLLFGAASWGGNVTGKVTYEGKAFPDRPLKVNSDPVCQKAHEGKKPLSPLFTIAEDGSMQWIFVYVKEGLEGKTFDVPAEPAVLDQVGCIYTPYVFGAMVGQKVLIKNSDPTLHNVHIIPRQNKEANKSSFQGVDIEHTFDKPEVMVTIKCDVHSWMSAFCAVMEHPFYAVTEANGSFKIEGLPAGDYKLAFWHRVLGEHLVDVTVGEGDTAQNFKFDDTMMPKRKKRRRR